MKKQQTKWTKKHMKQRKQPRMESEEATVLNLDITGSCLKGLSTFCLLTNASASRNRERGSRQFETCVGKCQRQSKYCEVEIFL